MGKPTTTQNQNPSHTLNQNNNFINHFSHPHRLQLTPTSSSPPCSACKLAGGQGKVYSCKPCNFSLHESCSKMKQVITHPSHPSHILNLLVAPVYEGGYFNCDGCGVIGTGFSYQCSRCDFDIHAHCAYKPLSIVHKAHPNHSLKLAFLPPYGPNKGFSCDVCGKIGKNQWLYRCIPCEFDAHVVCITQANHLQHSNSAPTPRTNHHAGYTQHQKSLPMPNQNNNRPISRPIQRPNRPVGNPNRPIVQNFSTGGPGRQNNNLGYNGPVGTTQVIDQGGQSFGQESVGGGSGSCEYEEFQGEVVVEVEYEEDVEGDGGDDGEANDEGEDVDGNGLQIVACIDYDDNGVESEFGGSSDAQSQCTDISDHSDLYPLSVRTNQGPGVNRKTTPNGRAARSRNAGLKQPRGGLPGPEDQIQGPRRSQANTTKSARNNAIGASGGPPNRFSRPRNYPPMQFNGPPPGGPSTNAFDNNGNNGNYNEGGGTDVYDDNAPYGESFDDGYADVDGGDCYFEDGGNFVDDQVYDDETYNDFESYSDITGGSENMYNGDESYADDSQYCGPNDQYAPMVGPGGGMGMMNNQNQYGQTGRPRNMGNNRRGGRNMNQGGPRGVQYGPNKGRPYMANGGGPNGPNGPNVLGNTMNTMVQGLCQGLALNMLSGGLVGGGMLGGGGGGGDVNNGGDYFGGDSEC